MGRRNRWIFLGGLGLFVVLYLALRNAPRVPDRFAAPSTGPALSARPLATGSAGARLVDMPEDPLVWRTVGGHLAAVSQAKLDRAIGLAATDKAALDQLLASDPGVFVLAPDLEVFVVEGSAVGAYVKIRKRGSTAEIWTVREALRK